MKERVYCDTCIHYHPREEYGIDNYCSATASYADPLPQSLKNPIYTPKHRYIGTVNPSERNANNDCPLYSSSLVHSLKFIAVIISIFVLMCCSGTIWNFIGNMMNVLLRP